MQVTNYLDLIPNLFLLISLSWKQPQASEDEITSCEISHPPLDSLPNEFLVTNNLDDEK